MTPNWPLTEFIPSPERRKNSAHAKDLVKVSFNIQCRVCRQTLETVETGKHLCVRDSQEDGWHGHHEHVPEDTDNLTFSQWPQVEKSSQNTHEKLTWKS